jgi:hypothetical protein
MISWFPNTVEPRLSEIKGRTQFRISKISDNSEIRLDVIRCNKNNIYSKTRLMLKSLWHKKVYDIYRCNTILQISAKKKSDILVRTLFHNVFGLQCPSTALSIRRRPVTTSRFLQQNVKQFATTNPNLIVEGCLHIMKLKLYWIANKLRATYL